MYVVTDKGRILGDATARLLKLGQTSEADILKVVLVGAIIVNKPDSKEEIMLKLRRADRDLASEVWDSMEDSGWIKDLSQIPFEE